jgi:hypothetical protein
VSASGQIRAASLEVRQPEYPCAGVLCQLPTGNSLLCRVVFSTTVGKIGKNSPKIPPAVPIFTASVTAEMHLALRTDLNFICGVGCSSGSGSCGGGGLEPELTQSPDIYSPQKHIFSARCSTATSQMTTTSMHASRRLPRHLERFATASLALLSYPNG